MELLRTSIITLAGLFSALAIFPYLVAIKKGVTKPKIVSWAVWAVVLIIGGIAALTARQIPASVLMLVTGLESVLVVVLGIRKGDRTFETLDMICLASALLGLVLWLISDSPAIAVSMTILVDLSATLPTLKHAWQRPYEETASTYFLFTASNVLTLLVVDYHTFTAAAYPSYVFLADLSVALSLLISPNRRKGSRDAVHTALKSVFSRKEAISNGALDRLAVMIGSPEWSRNPIVTGQTTVLTVKVAGPKQGDIYCECSLDPPSTKPWHWIPMTQLEPNAFTAAVGIGLAPGVYQVSIRAKCELGKWSTSTTKLVIEAASN